MNNVKFEPSLWLYSIHSNHPEIFHRIESLKIKPTDDSFTECLEESIKCHHNGISHYIEDNLLKQTNHQGTKQSENEIDIDERIISYGVKYYNYSYFPKQFKRKYIFYYLSKYNHSKYVEFFIQSRRKEINRMKNHYKDNTLIRSAETNKIHIIYEVLSNLNNIKEKCFYSIKNLKEITIPRSIESIGRC